MAEKDLLADILEAENSVLGTFQERWKNSRQNADIYALDHWTTEEKKKIRNQARIPYVFDRISRAVNTVLGTQRDTRFDIFFYEKEESDSIRAEVTNAVWKHYSNLYDFIHVESDVFQEGVVHGYGCFSCEIDKSRDYRGDLKVGRVPYDEIIWDLNFRQYDLSDAYWMSRMRFYRKGELNRAYPKKKDLIEFASKPEAWDSSKRLNLDFWYKKEQALIGAREFYERAWKTKYMLWQKGTEEPEDTYFESKKDAETEIMNRVMQYQMAISAGAADPSQPPPEWEVMDIEVAIMNRSVVLINGVLEETQQYSMNAFPYSPFFAYFNDGDYWSLIDRLKDPQLFINRMYSQIDYWIGTMAKGLLWLDPRTPANEEKLIRDSFGKTGGVVKAKYKPELFESKGPAPQLFSVLDRVEQIIEDVGGGANFLGLKQTASESGRAVLARQAQAGLDSFVILDNIRRTKQNLGEKIAWYLTNEITLPRKLRIVGDKLAMQAMQSGGIVEQSPTRPNVGYVTINTNSNNTIEGLQLDIVVDEAQHSVTKNQAALAAMVDAFKSGFISIPPPPEVAMELLPGIPESLKQQWRASIEAQAAAQKEPIAKVSVNYKDIPPDAKMQVLEQMGLSSDVMMMAGKELFEKSGTEPFLTEKEKGGEI